MQDPDKTTGKRGGVYAQAVARLGLNDDMGMTKESGTAFATYLRSDRRMVLLGDY